ncbi:MAG TPA: hypothetical protein VG674_19620 [Amycolatopsis sp.]|nr:hypothetical protein [Amycolatopsis sp.]
MGKHTQRTPGGLPNAASGAAPLALLLADPVTTSADTTHPLAGLPLRLRHTGSAHSGPDRAGPAAAAQGPTDSETSPVDRIAPEPDRNSLTPVKSANEFCPSFDGHSGSTIDAPAAHSAGARHPSTGSPRQEWPLRHRLTDSTGGPALPSGSGRFSGDLLDEVARHHSPSHSDALNRATVDSTPQDTGRFTGFLDDPGLTLPTQSGPVPAFRDATQNRPAFGDNRAAGELISAPTVGQPQSVLGQPMELA